MTDLPVRWEVGILRNGGILVMGRSFFEMGVDTPLQTMPLTPNTCILTKGCISPNSFNFQEKSFISIYDVHFLGDLFSRG